MNDKMRTDPNYIVDNFYNGASQESPEYYDKQHWIRLPSTLKHLKKYEIKNQTVCDMGAGSCWFLKRLDQSNRLIAIDGAELPPVEGVERYKFNLDYQKFGEISEITDVDHMMCFETFEHLTNPYNFIFECKKMMKEDALFHMSYPAPNVEHNTFYPSLLWPEDNFLQFMEQMAFTCEERSLMHTRFGHVHFYVFRNKPWKEVKMFFPKSAEDGGLEPPHVQVNI